jgi:hypothetical protein
LMICLRTLLRINEKNPTQKSQNPKSFLAARAALSSQEFLFLGHNSWTKITILIKSSFPSRYMYNVCLQKNSKISSTNCTLQNLP